jgi:hypothetical protein
MTTLHQILLVFGNSLSNSKRCDEAVSETNPRIDLAGHGREGRPITISFSDETG